MAGDARPQLANVQAHLSKTRPDEVLSLLAQARAILEPMSDSYTGRGPDPRGQAYDDRAAAWCEAHTALLNEAARELREMAESVRTDGTGGRLPS